MTINFVNRVYLPSSEHKWKRYDGKERRLKKALCLCIRNGIKDCQRWVLCMRLSLTISAKKKKTNIKCMFTSIWLLPTFSPFWTSFFRPLLLLVFDTKIIYRSETCKYFMWIVLSFLPILANIASINFQTALVVFFSLDILSSLYLTLRHIKWQCMKRNWIPIKWMLRVCNMFEYPC